MQFSKIKPYFVLLSLFILTILLWQRLPLVDPVDYFDFAEKRIFWGIPYFGDVISNMAFLFVGIIGLSYSFKNPSKNKIHNPYFQMGFILSLTSLLVAIGSSYFHLDPTID